MRKSRFSEEQIIAILKAGEAGTKICDLVRKHGITALTLYRCRSKYGGMDVNEARRLEQLEEENRHLKSMVAEQALDLRVLKEVVSRRW